MTYYKNSSRRAVTVTYQEVFHPAVVQRPHIIANSWKKNSITTLQPPKRETLIIQLNGAGCFPKGYELEKPVNILRLYTAAW